MPQTARILSVATALPPHRYPQAELAQVAARLFGAEARLRTLLSVFASCGVETRYLARPKEYYLQPPPFGQRNDDCIAVATELAETALAGALERAGLDRRQVDHLVCATTTGIMTPSLDALLLHRMGLRPDLERTPLYGIGCAGGGVGIARAADLARARPGSVVALVTVELCSLTLQPQDLSAKNVVGAALFGDGAAATLLTAAPGSGARVLDHASHTFPDSLDVMGWHLSELGLELVLSRELPDLVDREVKPLVNSFLDRHGMKTADLAHFVVHPGGPKVIDAMERALCVPRGTLDATRRFLAAHGNLSSSSVLFLLKELLEERGPAPGERALLVSFGPGFSAELVLLEW